MTESKTGTIQSYITLQSSLYKHSEWYNAIKKCRFNTYFKFKSKYKEKKVGEEKKDEHNIQ